MAKIIVIEDDREFRELVVLELRDGGHDVQEATDGVDGLAKIRAERPDLVVSDIIMPRMNGYQLRRRLLSCPALRSTPVIFITGRQMDDNTRNGAHINGDAHFTKPVDFDALRSAVKGCEDLRQRCYQQILAANDNDIPPNDSALQTASKNAGITLVVSSSATSREALPSSPCPPFCVRAVPVGVVRIVST